MPTSLPSQNLVGLTQQQVETYARDGFIIVPQLYTSDQMLEWKRVIRESLLREEDAITSGVHVWLADHMPPFLRSAMADPHVVRILTQLVGPNVEFLSGKAVFKNQKTRFGTPWHQDWYYWLGATKISIWIALDDATPENGCMKMIPGSHRMPFKNNYLEGENAFVNRIKDEDVAHLPTVTAQVRRGDAIFFHDLAAHASFPNSSGADRWSFISTYRDSSVNDDSKTWANSMVVAGGPSVNATAS